MASQLPLTIIKVRPSSYVIIRPGKQPESYDFNRVGNPLGFLDDLDFDRRKDAESPVQDDFDVNLDNIDSMDNYSRSAHSMRPYEKNNLWDTFRNIDDFGDDDQQSYVADEEQPYSDELSSIMQYLDQLDDSNSIPTENNENSEVGEDGISAGENIMGQTSPDNLGAQDNDALVSNANDETEDNSTETEQTDSDFQGIIRSIRGAALVYKREDPNGTFEELWIYNVGKNMKEETQIRRFILANTDINPNTQISDDGTQKAKTYSVGNVQFLHVSGLPQ